MILKPCQLSGEIYIPPSKSDAQRAILAAALASGKSKLANVGKSNDELQMIENARTIGAKVNWEGSVLIVEGLGGFPEKANFQLGESGLGFRLIAGQCAIHGGEHVLNASGTLNQRPMDFYQNVFDNTGLKVSSNFAPLTFEGHSNKSFFELDGSQSSQYISGLLMALPMAEIDSVVRVNNLKSRPYLLMTLETIRQFGIVIHETEKDVFTIKGNQKYRSKEYTVESDWSSASCWIAAAALGAPLRLKGLSMKSLQADKQMLMALLSANVKVIHGEDYLELIGKERKAFCFDANDCPDLFPALAVLAAKTEGISEILGLNRLQIKESDRGVAIQQELSKMGVFVDLLYEEDKMLIHGKNTLNSGSFSSHHDHRIAMMIGVLTCFMNEASELDNSQAVEKSYPDFWHHRSSLFH